MSILLENCDSIAHCALRIKKQFRIPHRLRASARSAAAVAFEACSVAEHREIAAFGAGVTLIAFETRNGAAIAGFAVAVRLWA